MSIWISGISTETRFNNAFHTSTHFVFKPAWTSHDNRRRSLPRRITLWVDFIRIWMGGHPYPAYSPPERAHRLESMAPTVWPAILCWSVLYLGAARQPRWPVSGASLRRPSRDPNHRSARHAMRRLQKRQFVKPHGNARASCVTRPVSRLDFPRCARLKQI